MSDKGAKMPAKEDIFPQIRRNIDYYSQLLVRYDEEMKVLKGHSQHATRELARWKAAYDGAKGNEAKSG